jgi:hypothetical protein
MVFLPSLFWSAYFDGAFAPFWPSAITFTQNPTNYYMISPSNLSYSTYRPVAGGITITCQLPELYATGRLIISPIPITGNPVGWETLQTVTSSNPYTGIQVATGGVIPNSGLLTYASAYKVALVDLIRKPLVIPFQVEQPTLAYKMKSAFAGAATWSASYNLVEPGEAANTAGAIFANSTSSTDTGVDLSGWNAIFLYFEGVPLAATYSGTVVNIEHILHCEGVPQVTSTAFNATDMRPLKGSTNLMETLVSSANEILENTTKRVFDIGVSSLMESMTGMKLGTRAGRARGNMALMDGEY